MGLQVRSISPVNTGITQTSERFDEAIARSAMYTANQLTGVKAIICLTESGSTPLWMSRIRSGLPIFALTRHERTLRRVALYRGVEPMCKSRFEVHVQDLVMMDA